MICALCNVMDAETECSCEAAQVRRERGLGQKRALASVCLHKVEFIERLIFIAVLCRDPDVFIAGNKTVHQIGSDPALVMVFEDELPVDAAGGQIGVEVDLDFTKALLHLVE